MRDTEEFPTNVSLDTPLGGRKYLVVYLHSSLSEQTTPAAHLIADADGSVTGLSFPDRDLDLGDLGGTISWSKPLTESKARDAQSKNCPKTV